ncbi:MAG: hypothetical protein ACKOCN_12605, partial [Planctomycetaceae bacterium]
ATLAGRAATCAMPYSDKRDAAAFDLEALRLFPNRFDVMQDDIAHVAPFIRYRLEQSSQDSRTNGRRGVRGVMQLKRLRRRCTCDGLSFGLGERSVVPGNRRRHFAGGP